MDPQKQRLDAVVEKLQSIFGTQQDGKPCFQIVQFEEASERKYLCHFSLENFAGDPLGLLHYITEWNARNRTERHKCWGYVHEDGDMSVYNLRPWKPDSPVKLDDVVDFLSFLVSSYQDFVAKSAEA